MEAMNLRKLKAELEAEEEALRATREAVENLVATTRIVVNTGGPVPLVCMDIPVGQAQQALNAFEIWSNGGGPDVARSLDVTSLGGVRTVIPFARIVMLRAVTEA